MMKKLMSCPLYVKDRPLQKSTERSSHIDFPSLTTITEFAKTYIVPYLDEFWDETSISIIKIRTWNMGLTISSRFWNENNAKVACRQLLLPTTFVHARVIRRMESYFITRHFNCSGTEEELDSCPYHEWSGSDLANYEHVAAVECLDNDNGNVSILLKLNHFWTCKFQNGSNRNHEFGKEQKF